MIAALLLLGLVVAAVVFGTRRAADRSPADGLGDGHLVRRFFQYLLLYGLLVVTASGVSGLLGRALDRDTLAAADEGSLARSVAFTVVGVPLFVGVALWSRQGLRHDPEESRSFAWAAYVTVGSLTVLGVAMTALHRVLTWAVGLETYDGSALASLVVWASAWGAHWWVAGRTVPVEHARLHHLAGSTFGLWTAAIGLGGLVGGAVQAVLGLDRSALLATGGDSVLRGGVTLAVGAPVWLLYWVSTSAKEEREPLWLAYVLLAGVGGGLVTAMVTGSTVLYNALVWVVGDPGTSNAADHFAGAPAAAGACVAGTLVWWYHHAVLEEAGERSRTEVRRIYEYLMSAGGLVAAAAGVTMVVVALLEAVTSATVMLGEGAVNTLLAAATLFVVGGPVWAFYWRRAQAAAHGSPSEEHASPTRRTYLLVLLGVSGVAAVVALLVGVYEFFNASFTDTLGAGTLRSMRFAVGILFTTAAVAAYHWHVYRADRAATPARRHGPRYLLLVGPRDPALVRALAHATGGRVPSWTRVDDGAAPVSVEEVMAALGDTPQDEVIVLCEDGRLHAIPIHRGPAAVKWDRSGAPKGT
jgi:hypothetical protein